MHSASQLKGHVANKTTPSPKPATITNFARYLAEQRAIHAALCRVPVRLPVDVVEALETDLWFLELEVWHADMPWLLQDPYVSEYATFLADIPVPRLACHFYNVVFAHLVGGNRRVAEAALDGVLPPSWLGLSAFYQLPARVSADELDDLRDRLDAEARRWTRADRRACVDETAEAFARASRLNALLIT
jgi:hypothetical protein